MSHAHFLPRDLAHGPLEVCARTMGRASHKSQREALFVLAADFFNCVSSAPSDKARERTNEEDGGGPAARACPSHLVLPLVSSLPRDETQLKKRTRREKKKDKSPTF